MKRKFGEEGNANSPITNDPQNSSTKFQKVVNYVMKKVSLQEMSTILEPTFRRVVKEEVEKLLISHLQSPPRRSLVHHPESFPSRGLQLLFVNKLPLTIFTNNKIEDEEHAPLQIKLIDAKSKNMIQYGPVKVEILVLDGDFATSAQEDWSESEFDQSIVHQREGKRPLLVGELSFVLVSGVGFIRNITFTDNSSWVKSRKFKLGVRVVSSSSLGTGIREAVSEAFVVLDHRGESYQKHDTPSLNDPVWRLRKISKLGANRKKLESCGIKTVKDFLMQYHRNPSALRNVLGKGLSNKAWDMMVQNANECHLDNTYYSYWDEAKRIQLRLNCVYKVIDVKFEGQDYQRVDALNFHKKELVEKLKQSALSNLNQLIPIHSLSAISPSAQSTIEHVPFCSPNLSLQHDGLSSIHQEVPEKQCDFNLPDSTSYRLTIEDNYFPEDDSTTQTDQLVQQFNTAAAIPMVDSCADSSDWGYNWYLAQNSPFGEISHPLAQTWGHENSLLTTSAPLAHISILSEPYFGVNISATGKPKAGWCKIRAAVMWKIVSRNAAARRKGKLRFCYY